MMVQCVIYYGLIQKILKDGGLVPEVLGKELDVSEKNSWKLQKKKHDFGLFLLYSYF